MSAGKVLVTGAAGMLGSQLLRVAPNGFEAFGTDLREGEGVAAAGVDLADPAALDVLFERSGPFAGVIHAAAYTAVDKAEEEEPLALRVNALASGTLAAACAARSIPLVAVGTDFVFDGEATRPYTEGDPTRPLSAYGRTKLAGERAILEAHPRGARIVRSQWLYGPRGRHFPGTIARLARERGELSVVADQVGSPTTTLQLAPVLFDLLTRGEPGIYHAACEGSCSWFDLAQATLERVGLGDVPVAPCTTEEFPRPAHRPRFSVLDCSRLTALRGRPLAHWREALDEFLALEEI